MSTTTTTTKTKRAVSTVNAVRQLAGSEYQKSVPLATKNNLQAVATPILDIPSIRNMFINTLVQRIAFEFVHSKVYSNPLSRFKKGSTPLGGIVQEIATNPVKDQGFHSSGYVKLADGTLLTPLNKRTPDTKVIYHTINRESQYPVSVSRQQLQTAFTSWEKLDDYVTSIMNAMYSGDNIDEFIYTKNLIDAGVAKNMLTIQTVADPLENADNAKKFAIAMNTASSKMRFPSSKYNRYIEQEGAEGEPFVTWSDRERQVIIMRSDVFNYVNMEVLAQAFQLSIAEFQNSVVEIDEFANENILAVVCDESLLQIYDNLYEVSEQQNAQGLFYNYFLTHFQTMSLSLLSNAVVFMRENGVYNVNIVTPTVGNVTVTPSTSEGEVGSSVTLTLTGDNASKVNVSVLGAATGKEYLSETTGKTSYEFILENENVNVSISLEE